MRFLLTLAFSLLAMHSVCSAAAAQSAREAAVQSATTTVQRVDLMPEQEGTLPAGGIAFEFQLFDHSQQKNLGANDVTANLDLVAFDASLTSFTHAHPVYKAGRWTAALNLARAGQYQFWVQGTTAIDSAKFQAVERTLVDGGEPALPSPPHLAESRTATVGASVLVLAPTKIRAEQTALIQAALSGSVVNDVPFAIAVSSSGQDVRVLDITTGIDADHFTIGVNLPKPAFYRVWIETSPAEVFALSLLANR